MGRRKITPEQRGALLALYKAGKPALAQKLARELGVSLYYGTVLARLEAKPYSCRPDREKARKWARALARGPVAAGAMVLALLAGDARAASFDDLWAVRIKPEPYAGIATEFSDRKGAWGNRIDPAREFGCAHMLERFGQMLRVTNVETGKSAICKVIDRGPHRRFWPRREIDLTSRVNREIGCDGYCKVSIERVLE